MEALTNAHTRRGGKKPFHVGITTDISPEVQRLMAENSYTGVTSDYVHKDNYYWFVFRALYGHTNDAVELLLKKGVFVYVPLHYETNKQSIKKGLGKTYLLPGFVFAYMTREMTYEYVKRPAPSAKYLKYYTDKTKPIEPATGCNPPLIISEQKMRQFMNIVETKNKHIMITAKGHCHFKSGDKFQVICGEFQGIVGRVARAAGQQRIAVELEGIGYILTAYIPSNFLEKI